MERFLLPFRCLFKTLKNVPGAWDKDQSVKIEKSKIVQYRAGMKITFILTS